MRKTEGAVVFVVAWALLATLLCTRPAHAEDGYDLWLRYRPLTIALADTYRPMASRLVCTLRPKTMLSGREK